MKRMLATAATVLMCLAGCHNGQPEMADIVGAWIVKMPDAPFPMHMFVFHSDGTVEQSNPDAGDRNSSDSNLMGVWRAEGDGYRGKVVELMADRSSGQFTAKAEIAFNVKVSGNTVTGVAQATFYDTNGRRTRGPIHVKLDGERVVP